MGGMGGYQAPGYAGQPGQYQTNEYKDASGTVHKEFKDTDKKKDKGHGGMLAAGAGGLAVGAIGGAVVANAMGESLSCPVLCCATNCYIAIPCPAFEMISADSSML